AEPLYQRALAIREKTLGPDHPKVAQTFNTVAKFYQVKGEIAAAIKYQERADETREKEYSYNIAAGSEKKKLAYLSLRAYELDQTLSLHLQLAPNDKNATRLALTALLRRKGRALDAMADSIATLRARANPEDQRLLDELASTRAQYATLTLKGP